MSAAMNALRPPSGPLLFMEGRAMPELGAFFGALPLLALSPRGDGHSVLVFPGLLASDVSTRALRGFLRRQGYDAAGWGLGRNLGLRDGIRDGLVRRLLEASEGSGRKVSLIGWSLGGLYARQLARMFPDRVRSVITLGSPFAGSPKATNAWRVYELASGHSAEAEAAHEGFGGALGAPLSVPNTAIYSRTDGICAWQICRANASAQSESIEVESSHCGMGHHPAVVYAIADRLAQAEGQWVPFHRGGWRSLAFPDPDRSTGGRG